MRVYAEARRRYYITFRLLIQRERADTAAVYFSLLFSPDALIRYASARLPRAAARVEMLYYFTFSPDLRYAPCRALIAFDACRC